MMVMSLLFSACSSDENLNDNRLEDVQKTKDIQAIRKRATNLFYGNTTRSGHEIPLDPETGVIIPGAPLELVFAAEQNLNQVIESDIFALLEKNNINQNIGFALSEYAYNNSDFNDLANRYKFNDNDLYLLSIGIEAIDYINTNNLLVIDQNGENVKLVSCGVAVAASVITTIGATTIATGWGLGVFIVGKLLSIASITMCAMTEVIVPDIPFLGPDGLPIFNRVNYVHLNDSIRLPRIVPIN